MILLVKGKPPGGKVVLCVRASEAGALLELQRFLVSRSWSWGAFSQLRLESQNDKKCDNFEEALVINTVMATLNLLNVHIIILLKSYRCLLCQTISVKFDYKKI